ncbi:MAG: hypothetical protein DMG59_21530 [Acidobacteria bacterium]|nr:MAG: hypothetical protein DMG59_21530 [Acidobacteriota bacterium]
MRVCDLQAGKNSRPVSIKPAPARSVRLRAAIARRYGNTRMVFLFILYAAAFGQTSDYERGVALFEKGQLDAAIPPLMRSTEAHPQDSRSWKALGVVYAAKGWYELAEPPLRRACDLDPKLEDACYYEARALYALNRFELSLEALVRAALAAPKRWKIHLGMAQALEALARAQEAEQEFKKTLALARDSDSQPGVAYGLFLVRQGRFEEAVAPLQEVLQRFPESADAHTHLGRALLERGQIEASTAHLERAVAMQPASAQAHLLLAKAYVRAGRVMEAQPHFEAAARYEQASQAAR